MMVDDSKVLAESLSLESIQAAAVHAESIEKARVAQMQSVIETALVKVLSDEGGSPLLIKRIPFICTDITKIKSDMVWIKWLVMGMVAGVGYIIVNLTTHALK